MGYTGFVYGRRSVAIRLGVSLCLIAATLLSVWSARPVTEVKAAGRGTGMFRQTPVNVSFNSPTVTPGTASVQIVVSLTVANDSASRPGTVEIEIPVDPAVVDVDVPEYARTAGPLIPNTYQSTDLFAFPLQLGDASAIRIELVPPGNSTQINSGNGVFCTVTVPLRSNAPNGSYPLDASADNPFATRFTQAINSGGNEIPFTTTPGTLTISDGGGCPAISISPATLPNGTVGTVYSQTLTASGGQAPYNFIVTSGNLPTGLSLSTAGLLSGTPTVPNSFSFTVRATDANICGSSRTYTLTIDAVPCPTITISPSTLPNATVGTNYTQVLTASGGQAPYTFSLLSGALPTGIALSSSGTISGTPTASGTSNFTIRVIDNNGCVVTPSYSLQVEGPTCPTITVNPASLPGGTIGTAYNQVISATGGTAPYSFTVLSGSLPPGVTLATNGTLSGTPSSAGSFTFTVRATDTPGCTGQRTYTVAITGSGGCGTISLNPSVLPNGVVGTAYNQTVIASGGNGSYAFGVISGEIPPGIVLSPTGTFSGTPTTAGSYSFVLAATDSNSCSGSLSYTIVIDEPGGGCNSSISLSPKVLPLGQEFQVYNQPLTATGGTAPYFFQVTDGGLPEGITLTPEGVLFGTATLAGDFTFTVLVTDASNCTLNQTLTVTIIPGGCQPFSLNPATLQNGTAGEPYQQVFGVAGGTAPYQFSITQGGLPSGLTLSQSGTISGVPAVDGVSTFTVQVIDSLGCRTRQTYSITVGIPGCPTLGISPGSLPTAALGKPYTVKLSGTGGTAPYRFELVEGALPTGISFSQAGEFSGRPTVRGSFTFTLRVRDTIGCSGRQTYTVLADRVPDGKPPTVTVTAPKGGEQLIPGSFFEITWTSTDDTEVIKHDIALSINGGKSYDIAVAAGIFGSAQSFAWTVPAAETTQARIRVTAFDVELNAGNGVSPANFIITAPPEPPDFALSADPEVLAIPQGGAGNFSIQVEGFNGFDRPVTLSVESPTTQVAVAFPTGFALPGQVASLLVNTSLNTPPGVYDLVVTGTYEDLTHTLIVSVEVTVAGEFALVVNPSEGSVVIGQSTTLQVGVQGIGGFQQSVDLSVASSDEFVSAQLGTQQLSPGGVTTLTINAPSNAEPSTVTVTITGTFADLVQTVDVPIEVIRPGFTLSIDPPELNLKRKDKGVLAVTINRIGGFQGNILVSAPDKSLLKKSGLKFTPTQLNTTGSAVGFGYSVKSTAPEGTYTLVFTGRDDAGNIETAEVTLVISK